MPVNITSAYQGEVLDTLLVRATTGNQLVAGGHIRVEPDVHSRFYIPRIKTGSMLQKRVEMPTDTNVKGDFNIDEKYLEPQDFMAYTRFNPRSFEKIWRKWQPKGPLVFSELAAEAQNLLLSELAKVVDFELGGYFINGEFGAGANQLFNGILTKIVADVEKISVPTPVALTEDNIIAKFKLALALVPDALRDHPDLKIFVSRLDGELYDDALTALPNKGADPTTTNSKKFKDVKVVPLAAWPKDVIVITIANTSLSSNLWAGVAYSTDDNVIQIDKVANDGELYFFKMLLKADTEVAFGEDLVFYDGRA